MTGITLGIKMDKIASALLALIVKHGSTVRVVEAIAKERNNASK